MKLQCQFNQWGGILIPIMLIHSQKIQTIKYLYHLTAYKPMLLHNTDDRNLVIRNGFLYDMDDHTDVFGTSTTLPTVDLVLVQQFEQLPEYARQYIASKAARRFASRFIGDKGITELAGNDEQEALAAFRQADSRSADANMLEGDMNTYSIINRTTRRTY